MLKQLRSTLATCVLASLVLSISGCGGGGGGGGNDRTPPKANPPPAPPSLTLSPVSASAATTTGLAASFTVTMTLAAQAISELDHIEFDDVGGYLSDFFVVSETELSAVLEFYSYSYLEPGEYTGTLNFYLCQDENCRTYSDDSPFALPYTIAVGPAPPPPPAPPPAPPPQVTPTSINVTVEQNDTLSISLSASVSQSENVVFGATDSEGRFANEVEFLSRVGQVYSLQLQTLPVNAVGTYSGEVNLLVCSWTPCTQDNQVPGSAVAIPYTITVTPEVLLQPVPTTSGLPEWETYQGNAGHTGYVPVTLNASNFSDHWTWAAPEGTNTLSPVTTGLGKVLVTSSGYFSTASVFALDESDGTIAWQHDFGEVFAANHPAAWGGRVFVATSGHEDTAMWSLDIADGSVLFRTNFDSQWDHYLAPTVKDGYVYTNGGSYGGMYSFKGSTGAQRWFAHLQQYDLWTPAVDDTYAYAYTGYEFAAVDRSTGERVVTIANSTFNWWGYTLNIAPVLPGDGSVVLVDGIFDFGTAHSNHLIRYNVAAGGESWRVDGSYASNPVVAADTVYVLNASSNQLEARALASGELLWTWVVANAQETLPIGNLIVTDNLLFLCTTAATYAIDLATHTAVWSTPRTGDLAISSNRVLYIVSQESIDAVDLF